MYYIMNDDGYFLFCFDNGYTSSNKEDSFRYGTEKGAKKDLHHYGLTNQFKVVYIEEK